MSYVEGTALATSEGKALEEIPKLLEKQNLLLEEQNRILLQVVETLKWLK